MAIVCCNLLLGYTLIKSNAASSEAMFLLYADGEKVLPDASNWNVCYTKIQSDLTKTYTLVLQNNYVPSEQFTLDKGGKLIFDLNGYTIDAAGKETRLFYQGPDATPCQLEIIDSSPNQSGVIQNFGFTMCNFTPDQDGSVLKFSGGTITGCTGISIFANNMSVIMNGGVITNNSVDNLFTALTSLEISGGEISHNTTSLAIIKRVVKLLINGGEIFQNITNEYLLDVDEFTMTGGKIYDNTNEVETIRINGKLFTMSGGEIVNNISTQNYSGLLMYQYPAVVKILGGRFIFSRKVSMITIRGWVQEYDLTITDPARVYSGEPRMEVEKNRTDYVVGEAVDLKVTIDGDLIINNNRLAVTDTKTYTLRPDEYSVTYNNGESDSLRYGTNTVTVAYQGVEETITIDNVACAEHDWQWVVDEEPTLTQPGSGHYVCSLCGEEKASEAITLTLRLDVTDNKKSYAVGDTADLSVNAVYTRSDNNTEMLYELTNDDYEITYSDGDALVVGENTLKITYQGKTTEITIEVMAEPEVPDDGETETPTTPEAPKAETPENNNTPWIMLFVGIGVGAVLLVGGITLGVVLSKRKNK